MNAYRQADIDGTSQNITHLNIDDEHFRSKAARESQRAAFIWIHETGYLPPYIKSIRNVRILCISCHGQTLLSWIVKRVQRHVRGKLRTLIGGERRMALAAHVIANRVASHTGNRTAIRAILVRPEFWQPGSGSLNDQTSFWWSQTTDVEDFRDPPIYPCTIIIPMGALYWRGIWDFVTDPKVQAMTLITKVWPQDIERQIEYAVASR